MRRAVGLALALLASCPAIAHAGWRIDRATMIAQTVWNVCPGGLPIQFDDPLAGRPEAGAWAYEGVCAVHINREMKMLGWEQFCSTVLHEAGHIARYRDPGNLADPQHSRRLGSVMYAQQIFERTRVRFVGSSRVVYDWTGTDRRCRARGRPYLARAPRPTR